jgi:transcriptional regulator with XRE-family HTH domain
MALLDIFADLPPVDNFEIKKESIAALLAGLMVHSNVTRAELAERLGWNRGQVTRLLSGSQNLTIKTIDEVVQALGWDWDLAFKEFGQATVTQPWNNGEAEVMAGRIANELEQFRVNLNEMRRLLERGRLPFENGEAVALGNLAANEENVDELFPAAA